MLIKRKHPSCDRTDNSSSELDFEIERERHETIEENGDLVIDEIKRSMYIIKNKNYGNRKND